MTRRHLYQRLLPKGGLLLSTLLLTVAIGACETVVDVQAPDHEPKLAAQSFFSPDSLWVVRVSQSVPFSASGPPELVDSATVKILQGGRVVARPTRTDTGTYVDRGRGARQDQSYRLKVEAPGLPSVEGSDSLPAPPPVTSFQTRPIKPADPSSRRQITEINIALDDSPDPNNYYGLLILQARMKENRKTGRVKLMPPSLFPFRSDDPNLGESLLDDLNTEKTRYSEAFFPDDPFNGNSPTLSLEIHYDAPRPGATVVIHRAFAVAVLTVSMDFYRYWETASEQAIVNNNPFSEPLRVHSNVENGLGVFAGFQYRLFPVGADTLGAGGIRLSGICRFLGNRLPLCPGSSAAL